MTIESQTDRPYLKTISKPSQICNHSQNLSLAKQQYSFAHSHRFGSSKPNFNCQAEFYTVNQKLFRSGRSCSQGIGDRYDFSKNARNTPSPDIYYLKNKTIEERAAHGFSFGMSREQCPQLSILPTLRKSSEKPGPGAYDPHLPDKGQSVTFHIKLSTHRYQNPYTGPGKYDILSSFQPSKLVLNSKFRSTKSTKFAPLRNLTQVNNCKVKKEGDELACDKAYQMNKTGSFFNSKYRNSMCRYFGKEERGTAKRNTDAPGPGAYKQLSEFGFYESSKVIGTK